MNGNLIYRFWYYFRVGYSTYLAFPVAEIGFLTIIYQGLILPIFGSTVFGFLTRDVIIFVVAATILITPIGILTGYLHIKRLPAWVAELDIGVEANPWNYRAIPGKERDARIPFELYMLRTLKKIAVRDNLLTPAERAELDAVESKLNLLVHGKMVSPPDKRL